MNKDICFYFPYYEDSGVPVLFYRIANKIAKDYSEIQISVIDYEGGAMWRNLANLSNIQKIKFEDGVKVSPPDDSILVIQPVVPYYWPEELVLKDNHRIFCWNLHPQNLTPSFLPFPYLRELQYTHFWVYKTASFFFPTIKNRLQDFVKTMIYNNGLVFMDKTNLDFTRKYLFLDIKKRHFLPVPAGPLNSTMIKRKSEDFNSLVRFGWIGRLCDFKSHILVYSIQKLNELKSHFEGRKFEFHIIGNGPFETYIKENVKNCNSISIHFHGGIPHDQIDEFLVNKIDILMAMGTSALEGAKLGIPTFLLDLSLKKINKDYVFRMLFNTQEYDLGHFVNANDFIEKNSSLYDLLNEIFERYEDYAKKTLDYFLKNHEIDSIKDLFIKHVNNSTLNFGMLDKKIFKQLTLLTLINKLRS